jgi:diguanylate cyclase (GGDEF)-like protein
MRARQEAGGRRQEENNYSIKTGFGISIGVANFINTDESLGQLLKRADKALFKAKAQGRNQIVAGTTS